MCAGFRNLYGSGSPSRPRVYLRLQRTAAVCFRRAGTQPRQFKLPTAIDSFDDSFAVLDSELAQIVVFQPTEYGRLITSAVKSAYAREYDAACEDWLQTLKYTSKSELSYCGVGDAMFNKGDYAQAMRYYSWETAGNTTRRPLSSIASGLWIATLCFLSAAPPSYWPCWSGFTSIEKNAAVRGKRDEGWEKS